MMLILALKRLYEGVTGSLVAPFSILPGATARMNNPEGLFPSGERGKGSSASGASVCLPPQRLIPSSGGDESPTASCITV